MHNLINDSLHRQVTVEVACRNLVKIIAITFNYYVTEGL